MHLGKYPLPSTSNVRYKIRDNRGEKSEILTSTPYKDQLVAKKTLHEGMKAKAEEKRAKIEEKKAEEQKVREMKRQMRKEKVNGSANTAQKNKNIQPQKRNRPSNSAKLNVNMSEEAVKQF
ncbi:hypothetical protein QE152_g19957 [Popillia japonica]|uniref:Uncharacterized protein n=1 Tax=Popillia japonica TaxID=7064 RepID=A0AAW1KMK0_POPJA